MAAMIIGVLSIAACAARVPPASAEEHRRLAQAAEELGIAEEAQYNPNLTVPTIPCMELCFSPWTNPTLVHHAEAKRLWRIAKRQQRASRKLRVAEERACLGVPEHARDIDEFIDCSGIVAIEWPRRREDPFIVELAIPDAKVDEFRASMACHVARNESRNGELPAMDDCSLIASGARAEVVAIHEDRIRVELRSSDARARAELRDRLMALIVERAMLVRQQSK